MLCLNLSKCQYRHAKLVSQVTPHSCRYSSGTEEAAPREHAPPMRPEFPPPHLNFQQWLPSELQGTLGSDLLFVWNFLHSFGYLLDLPKLRVHQLLQALLEGEKSPLLGEIHISMLRIVQADMEEAHATGAMQVECISWKACFSLGSFHHDWGILS